MKQNSLSNIIEFQDVIFEGVFKNVCDGCQYLQGPGLPDICIVYKRFKKAINLNPFSRNQVQNDKQSTSSFHFVQGLCPQSQAEISAYFSQIIAAQETDQQYKMFSNGEYEIFKINYCTWDIFSRTLIVSQIEMPSNSSSLSQFKTYGLSANIDTKIISVSEKEIEGAYVSNVIRSLDKECRVPVASKFYRNIRLANSKQVIDFLTRYFNVLGQARFKLELTSNFQSIDNTLYNMSWTLHVIITYLERVSMLDILLEHLQSFKENTLFQLVCAIVAYKAKMYKPSIQMLSTLILNHPDFYFAQYLQAKAFIKLKEYSKAFLILQYMQAKCDNNIHVWTALAQIVRKRGNFQVALLLNNRAINCPYKEINIQDQHQALYLNNFRVLCGNKNLSQINQLEQIFEQVTPQVLTNIESYFQLVQCPASEVLSMKMRTNEIINNPKWFKNQLKSGFKISQEQYDTLFSSKVFEIPTPLFQEIKKLYQLLGGVKFHNLVSNTFPPAKIPPNSQAKVLEYQFELNYQENSQLDMSSYSLVDNLNRSMHMPKLLDDIDLNDEEEFTKPSFLKKDVEEDRPKRVQTQTVQSSRFNKRSQSVKNAATQNRQFLKAFKGHQSVKGKRSVQIKTIIQETANESLESERLKPFSPTLQNFAKELSSIPSASQAPVSGAPTRKIIQSIEAIINGGQFDLKRRMDSMDPKFSEFVRQYILMEQTMDAIFTPQTNKARGNQSQTLAQSNSPDRSPIFKSNLRQTLKNKSHLEKTVEIRDFYVLPTFSTSEVNYSVVHRQETVFLYRCALLALRLRRRDIAQQICAKLNVRVISVQLTNMLLEITMKNEDPRLHIKFLQRCLHDFSDCGVQIVSALPFWMEEHIVKMVRLFGANCLLGMLVNTESDFSFYLIKQVILSVENLK